MVFPWAAAAAAASLGASIFGGKQKGSDAPAQSSSSQGYNALPPEAQAVYRQYFNKLSRLANNPYAQNRMGFAGKPNDIFGSQELYNLQQTQPNQGVRPIGVQEPFNQVQQNALGAFANPDYSQGGLAQYLQPFQGARDRALEGINRNASTLFSGIKGREARVGSLARDPMYGGQLPQLEEARARAIGDLEAGFNEKALGLRQQSLADMLGAGGQIQQHNQAGLQAASGQGLAQSNPLYGQAQALMQLLQGIPNSSSGNSMGTMPWQPSNLTKAGNLGLGLFGNQFGGIFG
jgi:hypothetical protein